MTRCTLCGLDGFINLKQYVNHLVNAHYEWKISICKSCLSWNVNGKCSAEHSYTQTETTERRQFKKKDISCAICRKRFYNISTLRNHLDKHRSERYLCVFCNKDYQHHQSLVRHQKTCPMMSKSNFV
ncbi:hypothetical protein SNEBB_009184 [Seison nebaliae]|nr:hypothetical protein SNEBB_009184 [Seison nebaliae]